MAKHGVNFFTPEKEQEFLELLTEKGGHIGNTCTAMGISRRTYYNHCDDFPEFKVAAEEARAKGATLIEDEMLNAILTGTLSNGEPANNTLTIFYLKSINRDKYGEKQEISHKVDFADKMRDNKQTIQSMRNVAGVQVDDAGTEK